MGVPPHPRELSTAKRPLKILRVPTLPSADLDYFDGVTSQLMFLGPSLRVPIRMAMWNGVLSCSKKEEE